MTTTTQKYQESVSQLTGKGSPWEIQERIINEQGYRAYTNAPSSLADLINEGRKHGSNEFIVYGDERITFDDFFSRVDRVASSLINHHQLQAGDTVAIAMRNYPEWMISFAAISLAGAIVVPINSWGKREELMHAITNADSKLVFCDAERFELISDDLSTANIGAVVAKIDRVPNHAHTFESLLAQPAQQTFDQPTTTDPESPTIIMYTSGTTGFPKGAVSNHRNVCQSIFNFEMLAIAAAMTDPEPIGKMLERGFPPKVLLGIPLFHVAGCYSVFLLSLRAGRPIVMMPKWDRNKALKDIQDERITMISAAPTMLLELLEAPEWDNYDTSSLFGIGVGGAAAPARLTETIYRQLPDSFPGTGYGMTESNACGFSASGAIFAQHPLSSGLSSPLIDTKILNSEGHIVKAGEVGEIYLKSPTIMAGYHNNPDATAETLIDGWLKSGDVGYMDEEGRIFITDRIKDMIIRGGENIYSVEVESAALTHSTILEAAVFGIPHDTLGEEVALAVYIADINSLTKDQIQAHISEKLAKFKVPSVVYLSDTPLPKNATQKILKNQLKAKYAV